MGMLYRKVGRRYVKLGWEFTGFPADGIWLVERNQARCRLIAKPESCVDLEVLAGLQSRISDALATRLGKGCSISEAVDQAFIEASRIKEPQPEF